MNASAASNMPLGMPDPDDDSFDPGHWLSLLLVYWPYVLASVLIGLFLAYAFNRYAEPIYQVNATVLVKEDKKDLGSDIFENTGLFQQKNKVENEIGILKSFSLAYETVKQLPLDVEYYKDGLVRPDRLFLNSPVLITPDWNHPQLIGGRIRLEVKSLETFTLEIQSNGFKVFNPADPFYKTTAENITGLEGEFRFGVPVKDTHFSFLVQNLSAEPGEIIYFRLLDHVALALIHQKELDVKLVNRQADLLSLSLKSPFRRAGEEYLNRLMDNYLQRDLKDKNREAESTIRFIDAQLTGITDSLSYFEGRLERYRSENKIFNLSEEGTRIFERLQDLEQQRSEAGLNLRYLETLREYLSRDFSENLIAPSLVGVEDPLLNSLVSGLNELQAEYVRLTASFSAATPTVKDLRRKIESTRSALKENVASAISNSKTAVNDLERRVGQIDRNINALPETERRLLGLQRQLNINENIYIYLLEKRAESAITRASNLPTNAVLDQAQAVSIPVWPRKQINLLFGILLGFFLPVVVIAFRRIFYTKIEDPAELQRHLKVPLIGNIGRNHKQEPLPSFSSPRSVITESFRGIRSDMTFLMEKKFPVVILITSGASGEGKTFTSLNLAAVFALSGKKTILLGMDLRKPKLASAFGLTNDVGITTVLSTELDWRQAVKPSGYENLDVLLSGPVPPNPAELLLRDSFREMIEQIRAGYEVVILDCPPVGVVSETKELFRFADLSLYLFRQAYSEKSGVGYLNMLSGSGTAKRIYAIINDVHLRTAGQYGYGRGYGYGNGYGSDSGYHEDAEVRKVKPRGWLGKLFWWK
jgi:capsular exopolysaccharide synthesis family protein